MRVLKLQVHLELMPGLHVRAVTGDTVYELSAAGRALWILKSIDVGTIFMAAPAGNCKCLQVLTCKTTSAVAVHLLPGATHDGVKRFSPRAGGNAGVLSIV